MKKTKNLRLGAFQFRGSASIEENCSAILRGLKQAKRKKVELLALQECALSGYAPVDRDSTREINKEQLQQATDAIATAAGKLGIYISLGTTTFNRGKPRNSLLMLDPHGKFTGVYHKRILYGEDAKHYQIGDEPGIAMVKGIRVGLRICFEFRFPEYFRELLHAKAQLAVMGFSMVGKNAKKLTTARSHLVSRAAENGIYILAANNINGIQNCPSCIINPEGDILAEASQGKEELICATIKPENFTRLTKDIIKHALRLSRLAALKTKSGGRK